MGKYPQVLLNSSGAEIKSLTKPGVGTLVGATQGRAIHHIRLTMLPTRPSLVGAMRILVPLNEQVAAKSDAVSPRRRVLKPQQERGLVAIVGPNGRFYANAV